MENEIKKLIEKWNQVYCEKENINIYCTPTETEYFCEFIQDLEFLLEFKQKNCCGKSSANGIKEVYERFKHLDILLSDPVALNEDGDPIHAACYEFWRAIKNECA